MSDIAGRDEEIQKIEDALCALLAQTLIYDKAREKRNNGLPPRVFTLTPVDLIKIKTRRECDIARVLKEPVRNACKNAIRLLGERLFEIGGTDLMEKVCGTVEKRSRTRRVYRAVMMDKAWDGVGCSKESAGWVA
jgi:hypothetical protein